MGSPLSIHFLSPKRILIFVQVFIFHEQRSAYQGKLRLLSVPGDSSLIFPVNDCIRNCKVIIYGVAQSRTHSSLVRDSREFLCPFRHMRIQWESTKRGPGSGPTREINPTGSLIVDFLASSLRAIHFCSL